MSALEVWRVKYLQSGEEQSQAFSWFDFKRLKRFVVEHEVTSVVFSAKDLPESYEHRVNQKNVYEETVPEAEVMKLSPAWVEERRRLY